MHRFYISDFNISDLKANRRHKIIHHATVEQKYKDNKAKGRSEIAEIYS